MKKKRKNIELEILENWVKLQESNDLLQKKLDFIKKVSDECKEYEKKTFNN